MLISSHPATKMTFPASKYVWGFFVCDAIVCAMAYFLSNVEASDPYVVSTMMDDKIPLIKEFIIPYLLWFIYVFAPIIYLLRKTIKDKNWKHLIGILYPINIAVCVCVTIFIIYPTKVLRTDIPTSEGRDIIRAILLIVRRLDNPYNGFPSLHVLSSMVICIHFVYTDYVRKDVKFLYIVGSIFIIMSTLFTKQHYVMDVIAGTILAPIVYVLSNVLTRRIHYTEEDL